jgi:phosphate transport system protein
MTDHTNRQFDSDIDGVRSAFTTLGGLVERQVIRAIDSIKLGDLRLATQVLAEERQVNQMHIESDLRCNQVIARRQPIAVDLREIIAVLHSVNDLERIGDEAKKIALKAPLFVDGRMPVRFEPIAEMADIAIDMLRSAIEAFMRQDLSAAETLHERDSEVDALRDQQIAVLMARMAEEPKAVQECMALVFIVQSIERIGDHAKNIAEYVINVVSGVDSRHARSEKAAAAAS